MKQTIYLAVTRQGVDRMTKRMPDLQRGEIPIKLMLEVDPAAFVAQDGQENLPVPWDDFDVRPLDIRDGIITEQEAAMIVQQRLADMSAVLEARGYTITPPAVDPNEGVI
jgi:hypothetical protein